MLPQLACLQQIHGFEVSEAMNYPEVIRQAAEVELKAIVAGTKPYLAPENWKPVAYAATAPAKGVTLEPGLLRECFERNIACLNRCFAAPNGTYCDLKQIEGFWLIDLPGSSEGRMLGGAGHTLRWGERADMRKIVDTFVAKVKNRQTADGWCMPYPIAGITMSERSNYDRVGLTRGLIAAGMAGNPDAYGILRRFYDWFNTSPYQPTLLRGGNCNNGHEGGLLVYFSPVGKKEDLVAVERYFVQDFFIEQVAQAEPLALDYYPLSKPHSYLILAFQAWLDHYRATGAAKYLDAAKGAWQIINGSYEHIGGTHGHLRIGSRRLSAQVLLPRNAHGRNLWQRLLGGLQSSLPAVVSWRSEIRRRNRKRHLQRHSRRPGRQGLDPLPQPLAG